MRVRTLGVLGIAGLALVFAASAFAADRVIQNGIDGWATPASGSTFVDFAKTPIPAGFFCPGSSPFTGKLTLQGKPLVTGTPGALGATDTIVQRLDDAAFNQRGVAVTRIQFRALSLKSIQPIKTSCGQFTATASLDGVQPITRMVITRQNEKGGYFTAPLSLNAKITFQPVGRPSREALEIATPVRFPGTVQVPWRSKAVAPVPAGFVLVDTDGDQLADTYLPGTSNFVAGHSSRPVLPGQRLDKLRQQGQEICHQDGTGGHLHCFFLCDGCQIP
jgi:hypothetical protein